MQAAEAQQGRRIRTADRYVDVAAIDNYQWIRHHVEMRRRQGQRRHRDHQQRRCGGMIRVAVFFALGRGVRRRRRHFSAVRHYHGLCGRRRRQRARIGRHRQLLEQQREQYEPRDPGVTALARACHAKTIVQSPPVNKTCTATPAQTDHSRRGDPRIPAPLITAAGFRIGEFGYYDSVCRAIRSAASFSRQLFPSNLSMWPWCMRRSRSGATTTTSPSSTAQSSMDRFDVIIVVAFS